MTIYAHDFSVVFSKLLEKSKITCYQISQYSHLNQAYLGRLRKGEKLNPSPETVVKISIALAHFSDKIDLGDIERLFNAIGRSVKIK